MGLTAEPPSAADTRAAMAMTAKPRPTKRSPNANFTGDDGSVPDFAMRIQAQANTGASRIRNTELVDWWKLEGNDTPKISLRVNRSPKRLRLDPACSNPPQKRAAKMKRIMTAQARLRSTPGSF